MLKMQSEVPIEAHKHTICVKENSESGLFLRNGVQVEKDVSSVNNGAESFKSMKTLTKSNQRQRYH